MKKILLGITCLLTGLFSSYGQTSTTGSSYVSTAVPFLSITPDSRAAGMGDVGVATSADINSIHWNLSKTVFAKRNGGVSVSYTPWLKEIATGMSLGYFSGYYKLGDKQAISASFRFFNLGDVDIIDANGAMLKTSTPNEFSFDLGYSRKLSENFSMGVAFRYIQSNIIEGQSGSSVAADISAFYTKPLDNGNIAFGANISNIGSKMSYSNNSYYLPTNLKIGTSYTRELSPKSKLSISLDVNKLLVDGGEAASGQAKKGVVVIGNASNDDVIASMISSLGDLSSVTYSLGTEYGFQDQFFARLGYFYESEDAGNRNYLTTGLGMNYSNIDFDLAYLITTDANNPLKNTLRFTIGYTF